MNHTSWMIFSAIGLILGSIGGLGTELLDRFAGRSLEAFCRLKNRRERFGAILDGHESALRASEYLRVIGTVLFLIGGTAAIYQSADRSDGVPGNQRLAVWCVAAAGVMMFTHMWLPMAVARFASAPVLFYSWPLWRVLSVVLAPLSAPGELTAIVTRRLTGNERDEDEEEEQLEDDIRTMVTAGTREGYFGPGIRDMIQGVMDLHEDTVAHIMTPRSDVEAVSVSDDWPTILRVATETGRTRLPVYEESLDNVVGVLFVKDLIPHLSNGPLDDLSLVDVMRNAWTVPIDQTVEVLLREFLHSRSHMAIVLDEFQQTAGVVTIEDALEEIVGEIVDESDEEEQSTMDVIDADTVQVDGRVMIDDLNDELGWELPESDDYETIAGYILNHTGMIPEDGQKILIDDLEVEIVRATNRQIESVRLHRTAGQRRQHETA